jgi:predicted RNA-binding Zn ribbon-like protein
VQWVEHARVVTPQDCAHIRTTIGARPKQARSIFESLLEIRELIWKIATALAEQRPVSEKLRAALTAAHAESLRFAEMRMRDGAYIWNWDPRRDIRAAILGPITLSALTLLMEKDLSRTKRCAGLECGWLFFDSTKNKRRRWCEMRVCGNRAKVRAARARKKLSERGR